MDYNRNVDQLDRWNTWASESRLSYNQVIDVEIDESVTELFTVSEFKSDFAKIDTTAEDTLIGLLIMAARQMCEQYTGISFIAREVHAIINNSNGGTYLPYGPIGAIASVSDIEGNALTTDQYKVTGSLFKQLQWPRLEYIDLLYTGGYGVCPEYLVTSVKMQTLYLFEHRGDDNAGMSPDVKKILNPLIRK